MPNETSKDAVGDGQVLETDLTDLSGVTLAEVAGLREDALGRALLRIFADTDEQIASFESSI
jgi:FXSXX-COOH protein